MKPVSTVNISAELPLVYVAAGILMLLILGLWLYTRVMRRPPPPLAQAFGILLGAGVCIVLVTFASAFFPGAIDVKTSQFGPFVIDATGQNAIFVVAVIAIYGAAAAVVTYVLSRAPSLRQSTSPEDESPAITVEKRDRL